MSGFVSRWFVSQRHPVGAADLDADGVLRDDAIERWIADARDAYLDECREVRGRQRSGLVVRTRDRDLPRGAQLGPAQSVTVSAGATEIHPTSFTMAFRVRTYGSADDMVFNLTSVVSLEDPATGEDQELGAAIRDELIALEHAARHTN
jgi:acyl-CoA thioesterase FadM